MSILVNRQRVALLAAGVVAATGAALAPSYAAGSVTLDRTGSTDNGWEHFDCSTGADLTGDLPSPVLGPMGVPGGAGSVQVTAPDDTYSEYDVPAVHSAASLTSYPLTVNSPDGVVRVVAGLQPQGQQTKFLLATVPVPARQWQSLDLTTITFEHPSTNHVHWWGETSDDSGTLEHFVQGQINVAFRPAVAVLGCDADGGIGAHTVYVDQSTIDGVDPTEAHLGTIDREPSTAPTPSIHTSRRLKLVAGHAKQVRTRVTYGPGWPVTGQPLVLQSARPGSDEWTDVATILTSATGRAHRAVAPLVNTSYRWVHPQDDLGYFAESTSGRTEYRVYNDVTAALAEKTVRRGQSLVVRGTVTPAPPRGTRVSLWLWSSSYHRLTAAKVARDGSYRLITKATKPGWWPLKVTVPATATNLGGKSKRFKAHVTP